ncbi:MAG: transcription termination/antitermination protein NusA, partial [Deltaproteobacteria bacterium]|nr:transcription termination/antitermination protein NusA [Deltaproteobacteria bacterium]
PEVYEGIVEIKGAAREPGDRAKIAVESHNSDVDPVGACVGVKGSRVQAVVQELKGEKIDIVHWADEPAVFVKNTLSPAQISRVIMDETDHTMEVIVPDDQLSLAIGKRGQNVRLAAKLTGWKIDIRTESEVKSGREGLSPEEALRKEMEAVDEKERVARAAAANEIAGLTGVDVEVAQALVNAGYDSAAGLAQATVEGLRAIEGVGEENARRILDALKERSGGG